MIQKLHEWLTIIDFTAWYYLNTVWVNSFLDAFVPYLRNQWTWTPLYLFLLIFMLQNFRFKGLLWCVFFLGTFALSDQISAHVLKEIFMRLRPCNNPNLQTLVHIIVPCGSGYSFPSSHAANHFALGTFSAFTLQKQVKWIWPAAMLWALSVSYAQVYVGVHFPLDVTCGGLLGFAIGKVTSKLFHMRFDLAAPGDIVPARLFKK
ncbi:MAG: phosphatase PAP2 family protein [Sphingobacteriales bacterium]|nr:MAG: phosphatase PAP2 family protein [Sphingobacteriales bacterium]